MHNKHSISVSLPNVDHDVELDSKVVNDEERTPLPLYNVPVCTTFAIFEE